jgi:hypothetical protein
MRHHFTSEIRPQIGPGNAQKYNSKLLPGTVVLKILFDIVIPNLQNRRRCGMINNQTFWCAQIRRAQLATDMTVRSLKKLGPTNQALRNKNLLFIPRWSCT